MSSAEVANAAAAPPTPAPQHDGSFRFRRGDGRVVPAVPAAPPLPDEPAAALMDRNRAAGVTPGPWTPTPDWHGESLDLGFALHVLRR